MLQLSLVLQRVARACRRRCGCRTARSSCSSPRWRSPASPSPNGWSVAVRLWRPRRVQRTPRSRYANDDLDTRARVRRDAVRPDPAARLLKRDERHHGCAPDRNAVLREREFTRLERSGIAYLASVGLATVDRDVDRLLELLRLV
jgi:hypothetical protein